MIIHNKSKYNLIYKNYILKANQTRYVPEHIGIAFLKCKEIEIVEDVTEKKMRTTRCTCNA